MKRHFSFGFKALAACAMSAMLAVSCYDDSKLWEEIEGLEERVAALEEKLNTEVSTLNSKLGTLETAYKAGDAALAESVAALTEELDALDGTVDGYIKSNDAALKAAIDELKKADAALADVDTDVLLSLAKLGVVSVEEDKDGKVVITFVDESTLEIANEAGVVTIVDGKWAVVVDGEVTVLDALVHPDTTLDFRVGDDNTLYVSYDGKKTWESTGVVVNDETTFNVVSGYEYNEEEGYLSLTIGGEEYELPIYQPDNSSITAGRTKVFFLYGETKSIDLNVEGFNSDEFYVMSKPDGWKADIEDAVLTVTAPAEELITMGAADKTGNVLIHATTTDGKCKVAKVNVTTGETFEMSYLDGVLKVHTAYIAEFSRIFWGETQTWVDFATLYFGITPLDEYRTYDSFGAFIDGKDSESAGCMGNLIQLANGAGMIENAYYEEGYNEDITIECKLEDLIKNYNSWSEYPVTYDPKEAYVLWILPETNSYEYDKALYAFAGNDISLEATASVYNNVELAADFYGADGYIVGAWNKTKYNEWGDEDEHATFLEEDLIGYPDWGEPGPLSSFTSGKKSAMGVFYSAAEHTINLSDVLVSGNVEPDSEYFVWVLPYYANKPLKNYTFSNLELYTFNTAPLTKDANVKSAVSFVPGYKSVEFTIVPPTGGVTKWADLMTYEDFAESYLVGSELNEEALAADFARQGGYTTTESYTENDTYDKEPSTKYVLVTYTTLNGCYNWEVHEVTTHATFAEYVAAAPAGATIMLTENVTLTTPLEISRDLTLDLMRYTLSLDETVDATTDATAAVIVYGGNVTITGWSGATIATSGKAVHKNAGAVWVRGEDEANVTIEYVALKGNNWAETVEGQTDCMATVYVSNPNGYVTINSGEFYCVQQTQVDGQNQILNYKNSFTTKNIVVKGGTFYGMDPAKGNGEEVSYVAEGCISGEAEEGVYVVGKNPAGNQWIIPSGDQAWGAIFPPVKSILDFGVSAEGTFMVALNGEEIYGEDAAGFWEVYPMMLNYEVHPEDASSGVILVGNMDVNGNLRNPSKIPYYFWTEDLCQFDLTGVFMEDCIVTCERATTPTNLSAGGGIGGGPEL